MKPAKHMTDSELQYAASDLRSAIAVTHPGHHSNMDRYLADYRAVIGEQERRERKRCLRQMLAQMPCDSLHRQWRWQRARREEVNARREMFTKRALDAAFSLYWHHCYKNIPNNLNVQE